jgi:hypothetical protein
LSDPVNVNVTAAGPFIPEIWSQKVLSAVEENLVMAHLVRRDFEGEILRHGDTVNVPTLSNLTVGSKAADTDVEYAAVAESSVPIAIDKHKYVAFVVEDIVQVQSNVDLIGAYTGKAGYALAHRIDTDLLGLYSGLSQSIDEPATGEDWSDVILEGIALLDEAGAPETDRHLVIRPGLKSELLKLDKFIAYGGVPGQPGPMRTGRIGELYGCQVWVTAQVPGSGSPTVYHNLLFQKEAFALAIQQAPRVQAEHSVDALGTKVVVDTIYGLAELRDTFAVDIQG